MKKITHFFGNVNFDDIAVRKTAKIGRLNNCGDTFQVNKY